MRGNDLSGAWFNTTRQNRAMSALDSPHARSAMLVAWLGGLNTWSCAACLASSSIASFHSMPSCDGHPKWNITAIVCAVLLFRRGGHYCDVADNEGEVHSPSIQPNVVGVRQECSEMFRSHAVEAKDVPQVGLQQSRPVHNGRGSPGVRCRAVRPPFNRPVQSSAYGRQPAFASLTQKSGLVDEA